MKKTFTLFAILFFIVAQSRAQTFKWAVQEGGTDFDTGEDIAFDASGNVYMVGIFNSTADLDPGINTHNVTSAGAQDIYVVKLDSNNNFTWGVSIGGPQQDFAYSIAVRNGSVYVCGYFRDTVDFDPGPNVSNLVSAGGSDIFILKLDTASHFMWVKQVGGPGDDVAEKFTLDGAGNILVCGQFQNTVDFDPNAGVVNMTSGGSADAYVLKLDANGNYIWAGQYGNAPGQLASSIATDASNDVYVTGEFYGTTDFDPGNNIYNMSTTGFNANIYVLKWSSSGNFTWAVNMGNSSGGDEGVVVRTDNAGNPVVTGTYFGTVDFDPGPNTFNMTAAGNNGDIFVLKLTSATGDLMFAKSMGGTGLDQSYGLALSPAGNIYLTGFFSLTADFDPGINVYNLTASGPGDVFILELDTAGNFLWVSGFGGFDNDYGRGINTYNGEVYTCGVFAFTADFDPGAPVYNLSSYSNSSDAFLTKLFFCTPIHTGGGYSLCPGDSVFAGGGYQLSPGTYQDYFISTGGCDSIVTTVVQYTFVLNHGNDVTVCDGQQVMLSTNVVGASYLWSTGKTSQSIIVNTTNNYWVDVTYNGCMQSDTVLVTFTSLPAVSLGNDTTICTNNSIILDPGPGYTSYSWNNGSSGQTLTLDGSLTPPGNYMVVVTVTDSAGCPNSDTVNVTVSLCTGVGEIDSKPEISIAPVPADDFITIETAEKINGVIIFNTTGNKVLEQNVFVSKNPVIINTASFSDGIYYLHVKTNRSFHTARLVVLHK